MSRKLSIVIILSVILAVALAIFITEQIQAPGPEQPKSSYAEGEEVALAGKLECLPHASTAGAQTLECAFGFKDEAGNYYAVRDAAGDFSTISSVPMNEHIIINGTYFGSADTKYRQNGTIEVTSIKRQ